MKRWQDSFQPSASTEAESFNIVSRLNPPGNIYILAVLCWCAVLCNVHGIWIIWYSDNLTLDNLTLFSEMSDVSEDGDGPGEGQQQPVVAGGSGGTSSSSGSVPVGGSAASGAGSSTAPSVTVGGGQAQGGVRALDRGQ